MNELKIALSLCSQELERNSEMVYYFATGVILRFPHNIHGRK